MLNFFYRYKNLILFFVGLAFFTALLAHLDFVLIKKKITEIQLPLFLICCAFLIVSQIIGFSKWIILGKNSDIHSVSKLFSIYGSIFVSGMLTPARTGDLIASLTWRKMQGKVLAWSIVNRVLEGGMTIVLSLLVLGIFFTTSFSREQWWLVLILVSAACSVIFAVFSKPFGLFIFSILRQLLYKGKGFRFIQRLLIYEKKIEEHFHLFYATIAKMQSRKLFFILIGMTLLGRICTILANYFLLGSLGVFLSFTSLLGVLAMTWVSSFLAPTPNGLGIGDIAPSLMISSLGYKDSAGGFVIMNRLLEFVILLMWVGIWYFGMRYERATSLESLQPSAKK